VRSLYRKLGQIKGIAMSLISVSRSVLPPRLKGVLKNTRDSFLDALDVFARRKEMIPPRRKIFIGGGSFTGIGDEFKILFIQYGKLQPEDSVLEVGSGIGRMARPLTGFLAGAGRYEGFDIERWGLNGARRAFRQDTQIFTFATLMSETSSITPAVNMNLRPSCFPTKMLRSISFF
jgi:hypothetical protein